MAAGDQQSAVLPLHRLAQADELRRYARIIERCAAWSGQVLLEIIEHHQHGQLCQGLAQALEQHRLAADRFLQPCSQAGEGWIGAAAQFLADQRRQFGEVPTAHLHDQTVAVFLEALHQPTRHGALAHTTDPSEHYPHPAIAAVAQQPQGFAHQAAAADQVIHRQLRHALAIHLMDRGHIQGLLIQAEIRQSLLAAAHHQGGIGIARRCRRAAQGPLLPLPLQPGLSQSLAGQEQLPGRQMPVEAMGQGNGLAVADGGLHRQHRRHTTAHQFFRQACGGVGAGRAMAGVEHHQWQRPPGLPQGRQQLSGAAGQGLAVFRFQLQLPRPAVTGEVQHVIGIALQRLADLIGMAHLQQPHLGKGVRQATQGLERLQDQAHFPFVVEQHRVRAPLIRRRHRHQQFQWARQGLPVDRWPDQEPLHCHRVEQSQRTAIGQQQCLIGQGQQTAVGRNHGHLHPVAHLAACTLQQLDQRPSRGSGKTQLPQRLPQGTQHDGPGILRWIRQPGRAPQPLRQCDGGVRHGGAIDGHRHGHLVLGCGREVHEHLVGGALLAGDHRGFAAPSPQ